MPAAADGRGVSVQEASGLAATLARIREITAAVAPPPAAAPAAGFDAALAGARAAIAPAGASAMSLPATSPAAPGSATVTGAALDQWMQRKNPGSPLVGMGDVFVREGQANGIDPRALVAIARAESSLGSDPGARARHNAFGWGPHINFSSWEENIATVARGLRAGYLDEGLVTLAQIQGKYAPNGASNDPTNLNSNWLRNTTLLYGELGGDPTGSVAIRP